MPRTYALKFNTKFKGGAKQWEGFNHNVLNLFMNQNLTLVADIVLCLHECMQQSLETINDPESVGDEKVDFRTPTKRKRRSARDLADLQDDVSEDSELSEPEENETKDAKAARRQRSAAKTRRNEARQSKRDARAAAQLAEVIPNLGPLRPSMLTDPQYEAAWTHACSKAMGGDIVKRLDILKTDFLVDYNSKYYDLNVMRVKTQAELEKQHKHIVADVL